MYYRALYRVVSAQEAGPSRTCRPCSCASAGQSSGSACSVSEGAQAVQPLESRQARECRRKPPHTLGGEHVCQQVELSQRARARESVCKRLRLRTHTPS